MSCVISFQALGLRRLSNGSLSPMPWSLGRQVGHPLPSQAWQVPLCISDDLEAFDPASAHSLSPLPLVESICASPRELRSESFIEEFRFCAPPRELRGSRCSTT